MARDTEQPELSLLSHRVGQRNDDGERSEDDEDERGFADRVPNFELP